MPGKRILILYNRIPYPLNDGGNIAVHSMIEGYRTEGWQVFLLAMNTTRHRVAAEVLHNIYAEIYGFEAVEVNNDVKGGNTIANFLFSSLPSHAQRFDVPEFRVKLIEILEGFKPDVVQLESVFLSPYLTSIRKHSTAKVALRLHNVEAQVWRRLAKETANPLKRIYLSNLAGRIKRYERKVWKEYDLLIPITEVDAQSVLQQVRQASVITIPVGLNFKEQLPGASKEKWIGYHIGAMDWLPNKEAMAWFIKEVWPVIHKRIPGFHFQFAGRNMPADISLLHADGILCVGEVSDADAFIADKKILIVPLKSGGGIRVKILEAMAVGKLVISTAVGMQGIEAEPGRHYLSANSAEDFAEAVEWALSNKTAAEQIAHNGCQMVQDAYSASKLSRKLSEFLLQLVTHK